MCHLDWAKMPIALVKHYFWVFLKRLALESVNCIRGISPYQREHIPPNPSRVQTEQKSRGEIPSFS